MLKLEMTALDVDHGFLGHWLLARVVGMMQPAVESMQGGKSGRMIRCRRSLSQGAISPAAEETAWKCLEGAQLLAAPLPTLCFCHPEVASAAEGSAGPTF